ncbi:MAG: hypothetical protein WCV80_01085 [Candidatus Paceibacterota bacterium]
MEHPKHSHIVYWIIGVLIAILGFLLYPEIAIPRNEVLPTVLQNN